MTLIVSESKQHDAYRVGKKDKMTKLQIGLEVEIMCGKCGGDIEFTEVPEENKVLIEACSKCRQNDLAKKLTSGRALVLPR